MAKALGCIGLALWLTACGVVRSLMSRDVSVESTELTLPDGTRLAATLYRPVRSSEAFLPAAVVVHGATAARSSCGPGLSLPLARQGFLVLAIDLPGHADSEGSLPASFFQSPAAAIAGRQHQPEIAAAINFLHQQPNFDRWRDGIDRPSLVLVGHSLGGLLATDAGRRRNDVQGVVCIGAAPPVSVAGPPRNFLVVTGGLEALCSREQVLEALGERLDDSDDPTESVLNGKRCQLAYVVGVTHLTELASDEIAASSVNWLTDSVTRKGPEGDAVWPGEILVGVLAATLGGLLAAVAILSAFRPPALLNPERGGRSNLVLRFAVLVMLIGGATPYAAELAPHLEFGPVYFTGSAVLLLTMIGLVALAAAHPWRPDKPAVETGSAPLRGAMLGFAALALAAGWLGVPWGMTWLDLVPSPRRLFLIVIMWPLLLPGCYALAAGIGGFISEFRPSRMTQLKSGLIWLALPISVALGQAALTAEHRPLFLVPVWLVGASFLAPLPLWLAPGGRGMTFARAVCHSGAAAWLLGCHLPFVHGS